MFKRRLKGISGPKLQEDEANQSSDHLIRLKNGPLFRELDRNLDAISTIYKLPANQDLKTRMLYIGGAGKEAAIVYLSPLVNKDVIEKTITEPLLRDTEPPYKNIESTITNSSITKIESYKDVLHYVNRGFTVLFVDQSSTAYAIDTIQVKGRSIAKAEDEIILKGPKEAFNENVADNISLIRKKFKTESLINESIIVGKRTEDEVYILYLEDLVNHELLEKVKTRLREIEADAVQNLGLLEQFIEDKNKSLFPTTLYTERPDRAASFIQDGFIVLLMQNSPSCLVLPATFWSFFHTPEEHYLRFLFGNFTRALRMMAIFITLFTSAIYVAITNYHAQMIPPDLLLAIASSRERVPFPALIEVLIMEIAFELIREAGLRVPSPIGPTIGIVGALILGQAAVEANIISPIVIIVVALGGVSSFAVSDVSFNFAVRMARFLFIFSAGFFGFYGMTTFFVMGLSYMLSIRSFGVPYLAPMTPKFKSSKDTAFRRLLKNERLRPGFLKPNDIEKRGDR
nr:spore germination protein [Neobacillus sp. Marseille-Q6967]